MRDAERPTAVYSLASRITRAARHASRLTLTRRIAHHTHAGHPGAHGLVGEQLRRVALHRAGQRQPGADLVRAVARFLDLVAAPAGDLGAFAPGKEVEHVTVPGVVDLAHPGHAHPVGEAALTQQRHSVHAGVGFHRAAQEAAELITASRRGHRLDRAVLHDRDNRHLPGGIEEPQPAHDPVVEPYLLGEGEVDSLLAAVLDQPAAERRLPRYAPPFHAEPVLHR